MRYEFSEVLNDLMDYFLLGDLLLLKRFKDDHRLADDLANELVTNDSGDRAVLDGILIPLKGVENHPYTIIFTLDDATPELLAPGSRLQHRRGGYALQVEHGCVQLYTWRILQNFTPYALDQLLARYREARRPMVEVENGWYEVEILGGEVHRNGSFEPAFEFVLKKADLPVDASGVDISYCFAVQMSAGPVL
ncbi:hypothetical protein [Rhizobacter sp. Root1221]|uniref:hypothetical protein n=1 Tax=Rhizobacter sp. Root1221 TaxID=1736433 RepID=UPI0006F974ED|nr:hypothetical protein [Rhizobacter sp. Root1221]KQV88755.1 hypothetical protein ASC87_28760 [Rhizobacter sp. Root1221]